MDKRLELSLRVLPDVSSVALSAAQELAERCHAAVFGRGRFTLALSGGTTPVTLFRLLVSPEWKERIDWAHTDVFWADERCVSPDHAESNFGVAWHELLSHVPVQTVYRMPGELDPAVAARTYEQTIRQAMQAHGEEIPAFDCIVLGMGEDGHTASLFPGAPAAPDGCLIFSACAEHLLPRPESYRISMTLPLLNAARCCLFLATGTGKHARLSEVLNLMAPPVLPAQQVRPDQGSLIWMVDSAAWDGNTGE